MEKVRAGEKVFGGCCITGDDPSWSAWIVMLRFIGNTNKTKLVAPNPSFHYLRELGK